MILLRCSDCHFDWPVRMFSLKQALKKSGGRACRLCVRWRGINKRAVGGKFTGRGSLSRGYYHSKAIRIHSLWAASARNFVLDIITTIGVPPDQLWDQYTLDRISNNKGYEPGNLRWATPSQQYANSSRGGNHTHFSV